ncbi:5-oxoprolinase subunit PxpB [Alkalihalobacillus sp. MEB130]|uniref:5-oxoprolinase subunit PxpB n=1 Tax=Alkalihalobacillus sp. MEB130 TaxID=2976704 RepID=UPI0028DE0D8D|nr:5-oxoprolinase subunit PxpB [Alkalihalobacillus sp. MEB130]MDT8862686.1 5-oxoprolinase subunit PxpB [Alkalihalobacillus sp. MEB130]
MDRLITDFEKEVKVTALSESAIAVHFGNEIDVEVHKKVKAFAAHLEKDPFKGLKEIVPAFTTVTVFYDPLSILPFSKGESPSSIVCATLKEIALNLKKADEQKSRLIEIPVCYGGAYGPDLEYVAEYNRLTPDQVVDIHSSGEYLVYMIGFAPGFPYLGGMSEKIATPRKEQPRMEIPKGSVGIAGKQTGVYSISTPGGWQLIGKTPLDLFFKDQTPPSLLQSGDVIRFKPITEAEYNQYREDSKWL